MSDKTTAMLAGTAAMIGCFRLASALVEKGALSQQEAAKAMTDAANDMRSISEDDPWAKEGAELSLNFEQAASWLLGIDRPLRGESEEPPS